MPPSSGPPRHAHAGRERSGRMPSWLTVAAGVLVVAVVAGGATVLAGGWPGTGAPSSSAAVRPSATPSVTSSPTRLATPTPTVAATPTATPTPTPSGPDLTAQSTTDPDSVWVIVNKQHPIQPSDYVPADLVDVDGARIRAVAADDLGAMLAAAAADGVTMGLRTAFRSYDQQAAIRADVEARRGFAHAEAYSARPGYSEHQTGLAFDLHGTSTPSCDLHVCFGETPEGAWVAAHAAEYGFIVRYTPENTAVTGFSPESWHLRYVGRELAAWMRDQGIGSLEEVFGVSGGADYPAG